MLQRCSRDELQSPAGRVINAHKRKDTTLQDTSAITSTPNLPASTFLSSSSTFSFLCKTFLVPWHTREGVWVADNMWKIFYFRGICFLKNNAVYLNNEINKMLQGFLCLAIASLQHPAKG